MEIWLRLGKFAWPHRRKVLTSLLIGVAISCFWSAELLLSFPVIKVFLQGQTLSDYVAKEREIAQAEVQDLQQTIEALQSEIEAIPSATSRDLRLQRLSLLDEQAKEQRNLNFVASRFWWLSWAETRVIPRLPQDQMQLLMVVFGAVLLVTILKGSCQVWQDTIAGSIGEQTVIDLRKSLFRKTVQLDPQTVALGGTATLMSRFTYDLESVSSGLSEVTGRVVREPLKGLACITAAFWFNWRLTALSLCVVPLAGWVFHKFGKRLRRATQRVMDSMSHIYKNLEETFNNAKLVAAFNGAGFQRRKFHRQNRDYYRKAMKIVRIDALSGPAVEFLSMLAVLMALLPGAYLVLSGETRIWGFRLATNQMDISELSVLYVLLAGAVDPLRKSSKFYSLFKRCSTAAERVFQQMDCIALIPQTATPHLLPKLSTAIELRNVTFQYARPETDQSLDRPPALLDINVRFPAGETIAILGGNGSGKSTLVNLLPRFYDPEVGSVLWDDVDISEVSLRELRQSIAWVPQDTALLDDTIFANIRYGRWQASAQEIRAAARRAHVTDFTDQMPDGLLTRVGANGKQLSGGQRQRVALARAMLRDPQLLILDEPTSAIDAQSERLLMQSLKTFVRGRTTLIITHALHRDWLSFVDRVVVMGHGQVLAMGSHAELVQTCPLYRQLIPAEAMAA